MSFTLNTIFQLKAALIGHEDLTLNVIFDIYDKMGDRLGYEPTLSQLREELEFLFPVPLEESSDSGYDSDTSEVEWVSSSTPITEKPIEVLIEEGYPEYRNDIHQHKGYHWCSRDCEGAIFLCGNSFHNSNGGVTKCGYITRHFALIRHECEGSKDLYFTNKDSRSYHPYQKTKSSHKNKHNSRAFPKLS